MPQISKHQFNMKAKSIIIAAFSLVLAVGCTGKSNKSQTDSNQTTDNMENTQNEQKESVVYLTKDISPEGLVNIYKALGVPATGRVAIKMSTGEGSNPNYLKPELIKNLVFEVDGTIVECNTAYSSGPGDEQDDRNNSANHWKVIERHGFTPMFKVDIMDEEGEMRIPVQDSTHLKYDIVGGHMANYDFMIALNHLDRKSTR